jgi:hypothetical protein
VVGGKPRTDHAAASDLFREFRDDQETHLLKCGDGFRRWQSFRRHNAPAPLQGTEQSGGGPPTVSRTQNEVFSVHVSGF